MEQYIKIGIGVMILDNNKILLGHRIKNKLANFKKYANLYFIIIKQYTISNPFL